MEILPFLISAIIALIFYRLGRWSAFRTIARRVGATRSIPFQLTSLNSAVIQSAPEGSNSDFEKYANSIRHREKFKNSKVSG
jgi:hypothetical protein